MPRLSILLLCLCLAAPALADTRCALVIGNGAYPAKTPGKNDLGPLSNPPNDAADMAKLLQDSGIVLVDDEGKNRPLINADKARMDAAVDAFIAKLPGCSAALFYYSGHGVYIRDITREYESANYLLPVGQNFRAADPAKIKHNAVNAHGIKDRIQSSGVPVKLMILDACRERLVLEESKGFGGGEEFRPMNAVNGMMVVYATLHSYVSYGDKTRRNSVFTEQLLAALQQGGEITRAIGKAIAGVEQANRALPGEQQQHPWPEGLLTSEFCLQGCGGTPPPPQDRLTVAANVTGAKVYIGGQYFGETPVTVTAGPGDYDLRLEKPGYEILERRIAHSGTQTVTLHLQGKGESEPPSGTFRDCPDCPEMVSLPGGTFSMGSNDGEIDEKPVHGVTVGAFAIGKYEVTVGEFKQFVNDSGHSVENVYGCNWDSGKFAEDDRQPVQCVSWNDAVAYTEWLSQKTGKTYRLPTEAQWEYAARGGSNTAYAFGDSEGQLGQYAWYTNNSGGETQPVGGKKPNAWDLYDMHGNVWEWTCSEYAPYNDGKENACLSKNDANNPRVIRGGSWVNLARSLRASERNRDEPSYRNYGYIGFRLARIF